MDRRELAALLEEVGTLLELLGENPFKARAYYSAARTIETLSQDLETVVKEGQLASIRGIGEALTTKITQAVTTGRMAYHDELLASLPPGLLAMLKIPSLGPKKVRAIWQKLGVTSVAALEVACREGRVATLDGFGAKSQEKILAGIAHLSSTAGAFLWPVAHASANALVELLEQVPGVERLSIAGSLRRKKEICRDADILAAATDAPRVMAAFLGAEGVVERIVEGPTKSSIRLESGLQVDLRCVTAEQYPFALMYFTGSKEHNTLMRGRAKDRGLKLNEYGLFEGETPLACATEEDIFQRLGLAYIPPELREAAGEIEAAEAGAMPPLIEPADLKGVFHCHSTWSDGASDLPAMAAAARALGFAYLGISDHSQAASYAGGIKQERLERYWTEIDQVNASSKKFTMLKGIECDILPDGSMDYPDEVLARFDFVIASVHSSFGLPVAEQTRRVVRALENPYVSILGHMTGRLLLGREGYALDIPAVLAAAARTGTVIELNAHPSRLDLDWRLIRQARAMGIMLAIDPDAHTTEGIADCFVGLGVGRKGWLTADGVLNTRSLADVRAFFAEQRRLKGAPA